MADAKSPQWYERTAIGVQHLLHASVAMTIVLVWVAASFVDVADLSQGCIAFIVIPIVVAVGALLSSLLRLVLAGAPTRLIVALTALGVGACGIVWLGVSESMLGIGLSRVPHAALGLVALALLALGTALAPEGFRQLLDPLGLDVDRLARAGRRVRRVTVASIAVGALLPFVPLWLSWITPRSCAIWTAAIGAAVFAVPLAVAAHALSLVCGLLSLSSSDRGAFCPDCGYPRPREARCPECGRGPGEAGNVPFV